MDCLPMVTVGRIFLKKTDDFATSRFRNWQLAISQHRDWLVAIGEYASGLPV